MYEPVEQNDLEAQLIREREARETADHQEAVRALSETAGAPAETEALAGLDPAEQAAIRASLQRLRNTTNQAVA